MDVSGQHHAPAALPVQRMPVLIEQELRGPHSRTERFGEQYLALLGSEPRTA
jgi:hypothetical protein